uniref:Uncharacterized protein n=1 Tax=Leersia perrieri TaxID=77586 RepID=A0A0D9VXB4_9ORYZ
MHYDSSPTPNSSSRFPFSFPAFLPIETSTSNPTNPLSPSPSIANQAPLLSRSIASDRLSDPPTKIPIGERSPGSFSSAALIGGLPSGRDSHRSVLRRRVALVDFGARRRMRVEATGN